MSRKATTSTKPVALWTSEDYQAQAAKCLIRVGDRVLVTRRAKSYEFGWGNSWTRPMNKYVGHSFIVEGIDTGAGVQLTGPVVKGCYGGQWQESYGFAFFTLRRTRKAK